jgi:hypothetical protein
MDPASTEQQQANTQAARISEKDGYIVLYSRGPFR